jgi:hydrogenase maturation protease
VADALNESNIAPSLREGDRGRVYDTGHNSNTINPHPSPPPQGEGVMVIEHSGEPAGLMEAWQGFEHVILVDAVFSGDDAGTIHYFDLSEEKLPASFAKPTSHAVGVAEAVEFARVLGKLPPKIEFYGIEGKDYDSGEKLTPIVRSAMGNLLNKIISKI